MCLTALREKILEHLIFECLVAPVAPDALASVTETKGCCGARKAREAWRREAEAGLRVSWHRAQADPVT